MDTIMRDLQNAKSAMKSTSSASTILECVGADIDEPRRNISYFQTADVGTISTGGQSVKPGSSLQINLRDQGVLLYLDRTCLVFDLVLPVALVEDTNTQGLLRNAMALLQVLQIQLGSQTWGLGNAHKYAQMRLTRRNPKVAQKRNRGLYFIDEFRTPSSAIVVADVLKACQIGDVQSVMMRQYVEEGKGLFKCVIPLKDLMSELIHVPDDVIFLGLGQTLLINARFTTAQDAIAPGQSVVTDYTIKNTYIMKVYTELDNECEQRILRAQIPMPFYSIISQPRPWQPNVNVTFNLGRGERLRELIFGVFPTSPGVTAADNNIPAKFFGVGGNPQWYSPNNFMPMAPFSYIQLSMNGYQVALNQYQIQSLSYGGAFSEDEELHTDPFHAVLQHCHVIDLTRFGINEDWYGSGQAQENVLQVEYQYAPGTPLPYFGIVLPTAEAMANYTHHSFVLTQRKGELNHGIYTSA